MMIPLSQFATFHTRRLFAALLAVLLFAHPFLMRAELPDAPTPAPQPQLLQITILDGEGALNNIRQRTAREPIVEVKDENHKPVAGVLILFAIQNNGGASASFSGAATLSATTDSSGRAVAHGLTPNNKVGSYSIKITATLGALTAFVILQQTNVLGPALPNSGEPPVSPTTSGQTGQPGQSSPTGLPQHATRNKILKWTTVGTVVAVGTVLGVIFTRGNNGTTITPGTGTVGVP